MQKKNKVETGRGCLRLIACPNLAVEHGRIDQYVPDGATVAGHLRALGWQTAGLNARVFIDGEFIERARWEYAVPKAGQSLVARIIPTGGGEGGKTALRIIGMLAIVLAAVFMPGATAGLLGFAAGSTGAAVTAGVVGAAISIVGTLALNALIPPARARLAELSGQQANSSPSLSLTGSSNQYAPYAPIPRVYGRVRLFPPLGARVFTEVGGNDQYLRVLFNLGYGPLALSDFKIGETPLAQFQDVELEIRYGYPGDEPFTLFPDDVYEDPFSILLTNAASWQQRTSQANAKELSWDVTFPAGLVEYDSRGNANSRSVRLSVEARRVGESSWQPVNDTPGVAATGQLGGGNEGLVFTWNSPETGGDGNNCIVYLSGDPGWGGPPSVSSYQIFLPLVGLTAAAIKAVIDSSAGFGMITVAYPPGGDGSGVMPQGAVQLSGGRNHTYSLEVHDRRSTQVRASLRWVVPTVGQYETRILRVTNDSAAQLVSDQVYWTVLRTIQTGPPVRKTGLAGIALRIRATGQLNGTIDTFNCVAESILPDWNGADWVERPTSNPASIYRDILQGRANKRPKPDSRLDLPTIQDFHERCTAQGFAFNAVVDFRTTVQQIRQDVLAAGRGTFGLRDMQYSVVQDLLQDTPAHVITPRNSSNFRWGKRFVAPIHAFKVRFNDEDNNWQQGERIVYADGYDATNATVFEETDAGLGVTNAEQVYILKRRELAEAYLRADDYTVDMDFEQLLFTRGDRVQFQQDVILAGLVAGRIKTVTVDGGGNATAITFDEVLVMADGTDYGVRITRADGVQRVERIVTIAGETNSATFLTPIPAASIPAVGDLVALGESGRETIDCIVKAITPGQDYMATVHLLDYAPAIQSADSGPIPPFDSQVTLPSTQRRLISMPVLDLIQSDESVLLRDVDGSYQSRILVTVHFLSGFRWPVTRLEAQYRLSGTSTDWNSLFAPVSGMATQLSLVPVQDGEQYDLRLRAVDDTYGATSDWLTIAAYLVIGKTTPPPDVSTFLREGDRLVWAYPAPPLDFAGFEIRRHFGNRTSWAEAQPIHAGLITGASWPLPGDLGVMTYLIKGVDVAGNESASANWITVNLGDLLVENLLFTDDKKAASFPGTHNGILSSGNLEANTAGTFWSGNDAAPFWSGTDSNLFWVAQYLALEYLTNVIPDADKVPCTLLLDLTVAAQFYAIDYRISGTGLFWSGTDSNLFWSGTDTEPFWTGGHSDWLPWLGRVEQATRQVYEWRVATAPGPVKGVISAYQVLIDVPDVDESYQNVVIAATSGTRLPITKSYRGIKNVEMNLVNDGGTAITATIEDYGIGGPPLTNGPLVKTRDAALVAVQGKLSGRIKGW